MNIPLYLTDDEIDRYFGSFRKAWKKIIKVIRFQEKHPGRNLDWLNSIRVNEAIKLFDKCVITYPKSWSSMWGLGKAYQAIGDDRSALKWFEQAFQLKQDLSDIAEEAYLEALKTGALDKALFYGEKALAIDKTNPKLHLNKIIALLLLHRPVEAGQAVAKALRILPKDQSLKKIEAYIIKIRTAEISYPENREMIISIINENKTSCT